MNSMVLYHCTNISAAKEICSNGLLVNNDCELYKGKIFLSLRPEHIYGCVCFKVEVPSEWVKLNYGDWEYICERNIPVENVAFHSYMEDE